MVKSRAEEDKARGRFERRLARRGNDTGVFLKTRSIWHTKARKKTESLRRSDSPDLDAALAAYHC